MLPAQGGARLDSWPRSEQRARLERAESNASRLQARYRALYDEVVDILFEIDPIGVHAHRNVEKFVPEATSILARLRDARFADDVEHIVQQDVRRWYAGADSPTRILSASLAPPSLSVLPGTGFSTSQLTCRPNPQRTICCTQFAPEPGGHLSRSVGCPFRLPHDASSVGYSSISPTNLARSLSLRVRPLPRGFWRRS